MDVKGIEEAASRFASLLAGQLDRARGLSSEGEGRVFGPADKAVIGIAPGDGIGPEITAAAREIIGELMKGDGAVSFLAVEGLTLENRLATGSAVPDGTLSQLKRCDVILKGPTTTPQAGDGVANIESANVKIRRELDLYANIRPVRAPQEGIDWTFFRENTEGAYALGSEGFTFPGLLSVDFAVTTEAGTRRIARAAYEYARKNSKDRVSIVTKANVIKATDGMFLNLAREVGREYPDIITDEWYADILSAKLVDPKRRRDFKVILAPNLYGDILSDEAAEFQGGVGTAGSANIGDRHAMFEAIHGSAPRMALEGRAAYADPSSILRAGAMMLSHIGRQDASDLLNRALDVCLQEERRVTVTGRPEGASCREFKDYVLETLDRLSRQ